MTDASPHRPGVLTRLALACSLLACLLPMLGLHHAGTAKAAGLGVGAGQPSGGTAVLGRRDDPLQFDPIIMSDNASIFLFVNLYDPLLRAATTGFGVEPAVAASYEVSTDGRVYTFRLRDGIRFKDGSPVTAEDVKWSLDRVRGKDSGQQSYYETITDVTALDSSTVQVTQATPWAPLLAALGMFPAAVMPKATFDVANPDWEKTNGTGPYYIERWEKKSQLVLKRNPHYWQPGKPYLDEFVIKIVPDDNARLLQFQGGQLDIMTDVPLNQVDILAANPNLVAKTYQIQAMSMIVLNNSKAPFDDVKVRQALNYATDKDAINRAVYFGKAAVQTAPMPPGMLIDTGLGGYPYDVERAKRLLAESATPGGFSLDFIVQAGNLVNNQIATVVQDQWKRIGVTVNIVQMEAATARQNFRGGDYQAIVSGVTSDMDDPTLLINFTANGELSSKSLWSRYNNPQVNQMIRQADLTQDPAQRQAMYTQVMRQILEDAPLVYLVYRPDAAAYQKYVEGFNIGGLDYYRLEEIKVNR